MTAALSDDHRRMLRDSAVTDDVIDSSGVYSADTVDQLPEEFQSWGDQVVPALVFPATGVGGNRAPQIRPDTPVEWDGEERKYLFPKGGGGVLPVHPHMRDRAHSATTPLVIVEGTKQHLAAVSALAGDNYAAVGMFGCWGWSRDGKPVADLTALPLHKRTVYLVFDADRTSNRNVFDAAETLRDWLTFAGATVRFVDLPSGGRSGLDDVLATVPAENRRTAMTGLLERATDNIGRKPPAARSMYVGPEKDLLVHRLTTDILRDHPIALAEGGSLALYDRGRYRVLGPKESEIAINSIIGSHLEDDYTSTRAKTARDYLAGELIARNVVLGDRARSEWINLPNGMLDPHTETLHAHAPEYLSVNQHPVAWDPHATCPRYLAWCEEIGISDQLDDLEESIATMLDPSRTPSKAVFLFGPSRSGKSTYLRIAEALAGGSVSAVTLAQLSNSQYASANLYGSSLNVAADLSAEYLRDLSVFKSITGDDLVQADRKFGSQFTFRNRALFCFSANTIPSVGEGSRAYLNRIKPFKFGHTFEGRENPDVEDAIMSELPGILVRWVRALVRLRKRGGYAVTDAEVFEEFATATDKVKSWVEEDMMIFPASPGQVMPSNQATTLRQLRDQFNRWAIDADMKGLGQKAFTERLVAVSPDVVAVRAGSGKVRAYNVAPKPADAVSAAAKTATRGGASATKCHQGRRETPGQRVGVAEVAKVALFPESLSVPTKVTDSSNDDGAAPNESTLEKGATTATTATGVDSATEAYDPLASGGSFDLVRWQRAAHASPLMWTGLAADGRVIDRFDLNPYEVKGGRKPRGYLVTVEEHTRRMKLAGKYVPVSEGFTWSAA